MCVFSWMIISLLDVLSFIEPPGLSRLKFEAPSLWPQRCTKGSYLQLSMARTSKCLKTWCFMVMIWVMVEFCVVGWLWNFISILPKIQEFLHPWSSRILHQISWDIVGDGCRFGDDASALGDLSRSTARRRAWPRQLLDYEVLLYQLIVTTSWSCMMICYFIAYRNGCPYNCCD